MFHVCLSYAVMSVPCSLEITCWESADLLALLFVMFSCVLSLSHMVFASGVVLDCIDSCSLPSSSLLTYISIAAFL